jgi:hypothetical protein
LFYFFQAFECTGTPVTGSIDCPGKRRESEAFIQCVFLQEFANKAGIEAITGANAINNSSI